MEKAPKVSCLLAINRYDNYVPIAIQSILSQTFTDYELIILTNGDPGIKSKVESDFRDKRIKILYSPIQQLAHNLNRGLEIAQGEYVARMDGDDISMPERFEKQVKVLDDKEEKVLVSSATYYIDEKGNDVETQTKRKKWINDKLWLKNSINHSAAMFRKKNIIEAGGYAAVVAQDYELWLRLQRTHGDFYEIIPECHLKFRNHPGQTRGRIESYASSCGFLFREFIIRKDIRFLIGASICLFRSFFLLKRNQQVSS